MEETKTEKKKIFSKQNGKKLLSVLLVAALMVGVMYAFLMSMDEKTNTFTVGNIDITLHEDNWDAWYEANPTADRDTDAPDFAQNIVPNEPIEKAPYVTNDSTTNAAWVYLTVAVPTETKANIVSDTDGNSAIESTTKQIKVYAYGIQEHYTNEATETAEGVWAKYVSDSESTAISALDYSEMYGTAATDTSDRYALFQTLVGDETNGYEVGVDTATWTKLGTTYKSSDGYNYTVYKLAAGKLEASGTTEPLFDAVKLVNAIGDTEPVLVYYYTQNVENSASAGVGAAVDTADVLAPEIDGYTLYAAEEVDPGDGITLPTASSDIIKDGSTITWNTATDGTGDEAYTGMKVTQNTNLYLNYTELATSAETSADYSWLTFQFADDLSYATLIKGDTSNSNYPTEATTIVVPSEITVNIKLISTSSTGSETNPYQYRYYLTSDYTIYNIKEDTASSSGTYNYQKLGSSPLPEGTYKIPVTTIGQSTGSLNSTLTNVGKNVVLPDSVTKIVTWRNTDCPLESINIPYNCVSLGGSASSVGAFYGDSNLASISIPSSVTEIGANTFQDTGLTKIVIPESIKHVYHQAFDGCALETIIWLSNCPMYYMDSNGTGHNPFNGATVTNLGFIYSNSSYFYGETFGSIPNTCEIILTENTKMLNPKNYTCSVYYMGTQSELNSITLPNFSNKTVEQYLIDYPQNASVFAFTTDYALTADDLAIINAA